MVLLMPAEYYVLLSMGSGAHCSAGSKMVEPLPFSAPIAAKGKREGLLSGRGARGLCAKLSHYIDINC